ncbi:hypothetical protein VNO78_31586 [Psophocarpus tetragonolobus]|uniref:Uncharacterized protein n=1 Tax=Psophocarpus tetragonolobus TaxID=3891 RepID=A0AAN9RYI1_PSOTE
MGHSYPLLLSWKRPSSCVMYGCDCGTCKIKNNTRYMPRMGFFIHACARYNRNPGVTMRGVGWVGRWVDDVYCQMWDHFLRQ